MLTGLQKLGGMLVRKNMHLKQIMMYGLQNFIDHRKKLLQLHFLKLKSISEKHCKLQKKKKKTCLI